MKVNDFVIVPSMHNEVGIVMHINENETADLKMYDGSIRNFEMGDLGRIINRD